MTRSMPQCRTARAASGLPDRALALHFFVGLTIAVLTIAALLCGDAHAQTKLLRFPDIHEDKVVFCYAGDLWTAPIRGGTATRLTSHPGLEYFPRFSPDGQSIAFTGQYDGDEQVYVIPSTGGEPRQLTWYPARGPLSPRWGFDNQVYGWTRDGSAVLFRGLRDNWDIGDSRLYTVGVDGGLPQPLPMPVSGAGDLSPDGTQVVYSPLFRDFRTWKRYQGGWATDLYIFDLVSLNAQQITDHPRSDRDPMWINDSIYFTSDRSGKLNLYRYDTESGSTDQITFETVWDVRWPSSNGYNRIVYELDGELNVYDIGVGRSVKLDIDVPTDGVARRPGRVSAGDEIEGYALSPKGERALFVARGDVFSVPIEKGPTRNLTQSPSAHDRLARWSPDGRKVLFVSDRDGEEELYWIEQDGSGEPEQLTDGNDGRLYNPEFSPDGSHLVFSDKEGRIFLLEPGSQGQKEIADEPMGQVTDYTWSPHGGHLAFSLSDENGFRSIWIYSLGADRLQRVTGAMFNEFEPVWGAEGDYLYYFGDRAFAPQIGSYEWNYVVDRETALFALALRKDVANPFPPESDEVEFDDEDGKDEKGDKGKEDDEEDEDDEDRTPIEIDFDGLAQRVARVPIDADNYSNLMAIEDHLVYVRGGPFYYGRSSGVDPEIKIFSLEDREEKALAEGGGYALSHDGEKLLASGDGSYTLHDAEAESEGKKVSTGGMYCEVVPAVEWETIFDEVWRRFRDFFYAPNMHGYDWEAIREQYRQQLPHVAHRSDLNYVIGEMIAELNVSHAYIQGGDYETPDRPRVALPGASFELDEAAGRYRIARIYAGQNQEPRYRSPLTQIGVDVSVGDYVLAIDGVELSAGDNPYRLLRHKAGRPVTLTVNERPRLDGGREETFDPITNEIPLRYMQWVEDRRRMVDEATDGRVGYLHLPDMGSNGIQEFVKWYYGQIRKEGLIIDVRGNGGGNVSQMIIERLVRPLLRVRYVRTNEWPITYPSSVFNGHLVCILNETSASDGDVFPAMFKEAGLGPLIGKRSWGGVIGITGHGPLLDGGGVYVPQFGTNSRHDGSWIIEGYGVDPDIEVENTPISILSGEDRQLSRAIVEIQSAIESDPKAFPSRPADPVRTQ